MTGEQLYNLLVPLTFWGPVTVAFCVTVVSIAYVRGRRKL